MSLGGGKSGGSSSVRIPDFLKPLMSEGGRIASNALTSLERLVDTNHARPEGFTREQLLANEIGAERALSDDSVFTRATDAIGGVLDAELPTATDRNLRALSQRFINPTAMEALESTARGDFLFGNEGFDAAVDAAMNDAIPRIVSAFSTGGGVGGGSGGLAQTAVGRAAVDAFAREFSGERNRMLSAAGMAGELGQADARRRADAATQLGILDGNLRRDTLDAATALPAVGNADLALLESIGDKRQEQRQRVREAPINAELQLLQAALFGMPVSNLLGSSSRGRQGGLKFGLPGFEQFGITGG